MFRFSVSPVRRSAIALQYLSERTLNSVAPSDWVVDVGPYSEDPDVYICEAWGGAAQAEISALAAALADAGKSMILLWARDYPFPAQDHPRALVFDLFQPGAFSCCYTWQVARFGPGRLAQSKPFAERSILASYVGSHTYSYRQALFDPAITSRDQILIRAVDWWGTFNVENGQALRVALQADYDAILADSKFVFCPRGNGPSSKRRWEAAYAGAVPILIDDFTRPWGLDFPLVSFANDNDLSLEANARRLLETVDAAAARGEELQAQLAQFLLHELDARVVSPHHTGVRHVVAAANQAWVPGGNTWAPAR